MRIPQVFTLILNIQWPSGIFYFKSILSDSNKIEKIKLRAKLGIRMIFYDYLGSSFVRTVQVQ